MNEKLKRIIAVGGASLMAGSAAVTPSATPKPNRETLSTPAIQENQKINKSILAKLKSTIDFVTPGTGTFIAIMLGLMLLECTTVAKYIYAEIPKALEQLPNSKDLLIFLNLELEKQSSKAKVQLEARNSVDGQDNTTGESPENSYVALGDGTAEDHLLSQGHMLHGLTGKTVCVNNLAAYIVYQAGGAEKLTVPTALREDKGIFKSIEADQTLYSYKIENLTDEGKLIAGIIVNKLMKAQKNYQSK